MGTGRRATQPKEPEHALRDSAQQREQQQQQHTLYEHLFRQHVLVHPARGQLSRGERGVIEDREKDAGQHRAMFVQCCQVVRVCR